MLEEGRGTTVRIEESRSEVSGLVIVQRKRRIYFRFEGWYRSPGKY